MKNKGLLLIFVMSVVLLLLLTGCSETDFQTIKDGIKNVDVGGDNSEHFASEKFTTLSEILNSSEFNVYRRVDKNKITCISGDCPAPDKKMDYFLDSDCPFCKSAKIKGNKIIAPSSSLQWDDFITTCSEKHKFSYPQEFEIINKTNETIIAKGEGFGFANKSGSGCDSQYVFNISTEETWIFTTKKPVVKISVKDEGPMYSSPAGEDKGQTETFSSNGLVVDCKSDLFRTFPWIELVRYNDYNATSQQNLLRIHTDSKKLMANPERFTFASMFNGTFYFRPVCKILGKNSKILNVERYDKLYSLKVTGAKYDLDSKWIQSHLTPLDAQN